MNSVGRQRRGERGHHLLDALVEHERADRMRARAGRRRQRHLGDVEVRVERRGGPNLFPVVILGVHPEDGHDRHVVLGLNATRELDRRDGLQDGVERPAERAGLLAGHDGDARRVGEGSRPPAAPATGAPRRSS